MDAEFRQIRKAYLEELNESFDTLESLILGLIDEQKRESCQRQIMRILHSILMDCQMPEMGHVPGLVEI
jgi:chemotaxis protein histidine kinase CheA